MAVGARIFQKLLQLKPLNKVTFSVAWLAPAPIQLEQQVTRGAPLSPCHPLRGQLASMAAWWSQGDVMAATFAQGQVRSLKAPCDPASASTGHHTCHMLTFEQVRKCSPQFQGGEINDRLRAREEGATKAVFVQ